MSIAAVVVPAFGAMVVALVLYHGFVLKKLRMWETLGIALVVLVFASVLPMYQSYQSSQQKAAQAKGIKSFQEQYPKGQLLQVGRQDAWLFTFTNDNKVHQVLKIGNNWLTVTSLPPPVNRTGEGE